MLADARTIKKKTEAELEEQEKKLEDLYEQQKNGLASALSTLQKDKEAKEKALEKLSYRVEQNLLKIDANFTKRDLAFDKRILEIEKRYDARISKAKDDTEATRLENEKDNMVREENEQ